MLYYVLFSGIGIVVGYLIGIWLNIPKPSQNKQTDIYIAASIGLILGAKLPVWLSYGINQDLIFSGKSAIGGILGAFIAINIYKYFSRQKDASFGGRFVIPLAIAIGFGKIGCFFYGCCGGTWIFPVQLIESIFQFSIAALLYLFYKKTNRTDLLFPLYLLSYLLMRFFIEFIRIEPQIALNLTIYQILSIIFTPVLILITYKRIHNDYKKAAY